MHCPATSWAAVNKGNEETLFNHSNSTLFSNKEVMICAYKIIIFVCGQWTSYAITMCCKLVGGVIIQCSPQTTQHQVPQWDTNDRLV